MKRVCICVFYDKDGIVRDYFHYYIKGLKSVAQKIFVVANGKINNDGKEKLKNLGAEIFERENKGLDFGAWKDTIDKIGCKELNKFDELILTNNSCYGPIYPMEDVFLEMQNRNCDFWGLTKHPETNTHAVKNDKKTKVLEHIQSYFLVFKQNVFMSESFKKYWKNVKYYNNYCKVVGYYETKLTKYFENQGFKSDSYVDINLHKTYTDDAALTPLKLLRELNLPLIKRKMFDIAPTRHLGHQIKSVLEFIKDKYDINMIYDDMLHTQPMSKIKSAFGFNFVLSSKYCKPDFSTKSKTALILYVYYEDLIDYLLNYIKSMPDGTDIFIVSSKEEVLDIIKSKQLKEYNIECRLKENRGRDVSAYLVTCADVFEKYDYVCCMHDKKSDGCLYKIHGEEFSYHCFECNLKSKEYVKNIIETFDTNPYLGLLCPPMPNFPPVILTGQEIGKNYDVMVDLYNKLNLTVPFDIHPPAPFGAMFWVRKKALKYLLKYNWRFEDFPEEPLSCDATVSHAIERMYPAIVQEAGYFIGYTMPEEYASIQINNMDYLLQREYCRHPRLSFKEKLFSVKNLFDKKKTKLITIFNIHIRIQENAADKILKSIFPPLLSLDNNSTLFKLCLLGIKITVKKDRLIERFNCLVDKFRKKYPNYLSIAAIIKNEAPYIKEWIEFHRLVGVEKFYIYDNESTDNIKYILKPYIEKGIVEYKYFPGIGVQVPAYYDVISKHKFDTRWLAVIDADEFIVPVEKNSIVDFLKDYEECAGVGINWLCFDSNGHMEKPQGLLAENYTRINSEDNIGDHHIKSIINPRLVKIPNIHFCFFYDKYITVDVNKQKIGNNLPKEHPFYQYNSIKESITPDTNIDKIRINHYWSKSKNEYIQRVKKGSAASRFTKKEIQEDKYLFKNYTYDYSMQKYLPQLHEAMKQADE